MKEQKLNDILVKPVLTNEIIYTKKNLKSFSIIPQLYYNAFLCSKKKSGKTSLINTLIQEGTNKGTTIWLFCATYEVDSSWRTIIRNLKDKGYVVNTFSSIKEGKVNILNNVIEQLSQPEEEEQPKTKKGVKPPPVVAVKPSFNLFPNDNDSEPEEDIVVDNIELKVAKRKKVKKQVPHHLFIFDDISTELRNPSLAKLLKVHRHLKASCIISSQYLHDLLPSSILQLDYFVAFKSFSVEKLEYIHKMLDLSIPFDLFWEIYKSATKDKFNFLFMNVRTEEIRRNLNNKIEY